MFTELFTESTKYHMYFTKNTFWVAYGQGSGTTTMMYDIKKYLTDKPDDKNYDSILRNIIRAAKDTKPVKSKGDVKMYAVPYYADNTPQGRYLSVWGGDIAPTKTYYMILSEGIPSVVNFFDKKNEALAWIKSIA